MAKPKLLDAYTRKSCTITATNPDYAVVAEWSDGNPKNEDRIGYFVSIDTDKSGSTIVKSNSTSKVRGVTVHDPGFSTNAGIDKFDEACDLLGPYNYVAIMGLVPVIDKGKCSVGTKCMPGDDGTAIPSEGLGYNVVDRVDDNHILILMEPQADTIGGLKFSVTADGILEITY